MIVEPASIHRQSPLRRLVRAVGLVVPVALLAAALAAGVLGPKPAPDAGVDASALAEAQASPRATAPSPAALVGVATMRPLPAGFPASYRSIPVVPPSAVLGARSSTDGSPSVSVVAGYLSITGGPTRCAAPMITFGPWCDRIGTISDAPLGTSGSGFADHPPSLRVTIPAGVVLPAAVAATSGAASGRSVPAVVVGQLDAPASCADDPSSCGRSFVLDRVVWADGASVALQPLLEPGQGAGIDPSPPISSRADVLPLLAVLARPATVARLDPAAGAAAARLKDRSGLIWYVRDVVLAQDGSRIARWVLLDRVSGAFLATGPLDAQAAPTAVGASAVPHG